MIIGVPKEILAGERRVALVPGSVATVKKTVGEVLFEAGAGDDAGLPDEEYAEKGARIVGDRDEVFAKADIMYDPLKIPDCRVRCGKLTVDPIVIVSTNR